MAERDGRLDNRRIRNRYTPVRPSKQAMLSSDEAESVRQPVNHDGAPGSDSLARSEIDQLGSMEAARQSGATLAGRFQSSSALALTDLTGPVVGSHVYGRYSGPELTVLSRQMEDIESSEPHPRLSERTIIGQRRSDLSELHTRQVTCPRQSSIEEVKRC